MLQKKQTTPMVPQSPLQVNAKRYRTARYHLLLVIAFTVINLILLLVPSEEQRYFVFSATVPYVLSWVGMDLCGRFPPAYYGGEEYYAELVFFPDAVFFVLFAISVIIVGMYLLLYFLSGKHRAGWMIVAVVMFAVDSLLMLASFGAELDSLIDIVFHAWVLISLISGTVAGFKLKKLGSEERFPINLVEGAAEGEDAAANANEGEEQTFVRPASPMLRYAAYAEDARVIFDLEVGTSRLVYRKVGKVSELIIDGCVYAEYTNDKRWEQMHVLSADLDGHTFAAGYPEEGFYCVWVDGEVAVRKLRR
jgi:hypothetical protein